MTPDPVTVTADWLLAVRTGEDQTTYERRLRAWSREQLSGALETDGARLAFWINVYNAAAQAALQADPSLWERRSQFFSTPRVTVAATSLSLDDIEHGILRRSHPKWGFGYVPNPFARGFEREFRVEERDPRIHFALNCGAAACPPIAAYSRSGIDDELDAASRSYLTQETAYDPEAGTIELPRLLLWFRGDFGGRDGILTLLERYDCIPAGATPSFSYRAYDWTLSVGDWD